MLIGTSTSFQRLRHELTGAAAVDAPVLFTGEFGTGKEVAARTLHLESPRCQRPFACFRGPGLSDSVAHETLFGTGTTAGLFEHAHGGVLFFDEIVDLNPDAQAQLLRFLDDGVIRRASGGAELHIDARVIAATHVDPERACAQGRLREDLYYRLSALRIHLPPLRERIDDIVPLAEHFVARYAEERPEGPSVFSRSAHLALWSHDWPGNVRELANRVRRAVVMGTGDTIGPADLGFNALDAEIPASEGLAIIASAPARTPRPTRQ